MSYSNRASMQLASASGQLAGRGDALTSRKARNGRQQQQQQQQQQNQASGPLEQQGPAVPPAGPAPSAQRPHPEAGARHSSEDSDYTGLLEAMDRDLGGPETPPPEVFQEQPPSPAAHGKAAAAKGKVQRKNKAQKKREEKERRTKARPQGEELKEAPLDNDDSSSTTTETSNPDVEASIKEEPVKKKGRPITPDKEKEDRPAFPIKPKNKKTANVKKDIPAEVKASSLELPYVTPLENKRKIFPKNVIHPALAGAPKSRNLQKQRAMPCGKSEDCRPLPLGKFRSNGSVPELGNSSSSEGEKDSPPPEWDSVPLLKSGSTADSLQQISIQTMNADPFLKRPISAISCSPPPPPHPGAPRVLQQRGQCQQRDRSGYDKSPGGSGPAKGAGPKAEAPGTIHHMMSVESDGSDSSGLWSPINSATSPSYNPVNSFSAFGPNNTFNLSGVFSDMTFPKAQEPQPSWADFSGVPSSIWDAPAPDPLHSWPSSSGSPTAPTASILGNGSGLWSSTTPYSSSIWSASGDSGLHPYTPPAAGPLGDLMGPPEAPAPASHGPTELGRAYNPWSMWRPTLGRRSSEPWPSPRTTATENPPPRSPLHPGPAPWPPPPWPSPLPSLPNRNSRHGRFFFF
ncbi:hypothetical protein COCON_G00200630 [Conger conger]|uniref:Uncharacterized protein n=1 Tax=Conger conger TaxID=82655 RepID=A0A9Q1D2N8_CONCO|nr:hypothetical protein COCON_G00200630 [Conger conger]